VQVRGEDDHQYEIRPRTPQCRVDAYVGQEERVEGVPSAFYHAMNLNRRITLVEMQGERDLPK